MDAVGEPSLLTTHGRERPGHRGSSASQREGSVVDDALHEERGTQALDAGESGDALVVNPLEGGQVAGDDAQEVVGLTEETLCLQDVGDVGDGLFERLNCLAVCTAHGDEDEGLKAETESVGVKVGAVAADRA